MLPGFQLARWMLGVAVRRNHRDLGYAAPDAVGAAPADGRTAAIYVGHGLEFTPPER